MSPLSEDKLVSFLAEIQSDIRQIKSDLQALVMLLKQQEKTPTSFSDGDHMAIPLRAGSQRRLKTYFAICERHEERMIWENSYGHRMPKGVIANVPVRPTWIKSNVRVTSALPLKTDSQQTLREFGSVPNANIHRPARSSRRRGCCQLTNRLRDLPRVLARPP